MSFSAKFLKTFSLATPIFLVFSIAYAGVDGSITGTVTDADGVAVPNVHVKVVSSAGTTLKETNSSTTGEYQFFPLTIGDYEVVIDQPEYAPFHSPVHVSSGGAAVVDAKLEAKSPVPKTTSKEIVLEVKAKKRAITNRASTSSTEITHDQIEQLPQGNDISLPRLLETTAPGVVQGPFNQTFIRGNHADVQYQIDGVQLPDSTSGTFSEAFSPRNIDHFEFITGGIPAEYGERLAAVVNIVTKTGPEKPEGLLELNYGTYNTFSPQLMYGGSTPSGDIHYFLSANYNRTDRGIDVPNPKTTALNDQSQGGDPTHDFNNGNSQFLKIDWLPDNQDKYSLILFQSYNFYQIPNFPGSFSPSDPYFSANTQSPYTDAFGNTNGGASPVFNYAPAGTNDTQANEDAYAQVVWKHAFGERSFLQIAPYWKYSKVKVSNDPTNDLLSANDCPSGPNCIPGSTPSSFALNRHVNNLGLKADYSIRPDDINLVKAGIQIQGSEAGDSFSVLNPTGGVASFTGGGTDLGYFEAAYVQDDVQIAKPLLLNVGVRFTANQFHFDDASPTDYQFQPRIGLNFLVTDSTKLHVFYGRLYQPAPLEDLREAFDQANAPVPGQSGGGTTATFYDVKAETDNYYEAGVDQQVGESHLATVNVYYKTATNMLDDTQLLNTSIASPYNYANGYAYGVEFSWKGRLTSELSDYFNYSYEIAKGENISGGTFAITPNNLPPPNTYIFLDHVQVHTANAGVSYSKDRYFASAQGLFGSGLRTGPSNANSLPAHLTFDATAGYEFKGDTWLTQWKVSGDVLNIFDNAYAISIANGFNGSHYAAGREFFIRLTKEL
jgi:outer membrane cobalamin receptor